MMDGLEDKDTILFIQRRYHTNQYPTVTALQEHGHTVRFLSLRRGPNEDYSNLEPDFLSYSWLFLLCYSFAKYLFGSNFLHRYGIPRPLWYYRYLTDVKPDLIIVKKYFVVSFVTVLFARLLGIDVLFYDQAPVYADSSSYKKRRLMSKFYYLLYRERFVRYSPVLGNPDEELALPRSYYIPFVAPRSPQSLEREYFAGDQVNIMMVGKLGQERKNHLLLLRTVNSLRDEFDLSVTLIGSLADETDDYYNRIKSYVSQQGLEDTVTIRANLEYDTVQEAYRNHDVYVLPSRGEPAAVSHLEAMRYGLAIICTETNGTSCYIDEGRNGYLIAGDDQNDLETKLRKLLESRDRVRTFGAHSRHLTETKFSGDEFHRQLSSLVAKNYG